METSVPIFTWHAVTRDKHQLFLHERSILSRGLTPHLFPAVEFVHRVQHGHNVFHRCFCLNVVDGIEHKASVL